jgi:hypothetical protein
MEQTHMRRVVSIGVLILLVFPALWPQAVRAASFPYNDPRGQWSIVLPDPYAHVSDQYELWDTAHPGFAATSVFTASNRRIVIVSDRECCGPSTLMQVTQDDLDLFRKANPSVLMDTAGIQPTTLGGQPALRYDYSLTVQGYPMKWRAITALSGGLLYGLLFASLDTAFGAMANDSARISGSFRFFGRSVADSVYIDPQGRFTFAVPSFYDTVPNFLVNQQEDSLSLATLSPNPAADANADAQITIMTTRARPGTTFDALFTHFATKGQDFLTKVGVQSDPPGVQRISLDGHPAGMSDDDESSDTGTRFHVTRVFTLLGQTQYQIIFALPENGPRSAVNPVDIVLSSFHFRDAAMPSKPSLATWTDPDGLVQLRYPAGWHVTIESSSDSSVLELIGPNDTYFYLDIFDPQT